MLSVINNIKLWKHLKTLHVFGTITKLLLHSTELVNSAALNSMYDTMVDPSSVDHFRCPDDAISTATATMNISNMLPSSRYVLFDDLRYSPNKTTPQKVLTSGSACHNL